jgi:hypothetical protein
MSCRDIHGKLMQFYSLFVSLIIHLPDKECMQPVCRKKTRLKGIFHLIRLEPPASIITLFRMNLLQVLQIL